MEFGDFLTKTKVFFIKRLSELFGLIIIVFAFLILVSLISHSPDDPNFILDNDADIQNLLGFRGSITSDFLFQSVGLISYLIPFTLFFSGLIIFINKRQIVFIDNLFFCILYIIFGSLFFTYFHDQSFHLTINGNGGFGAISGPIICSLFIRLFGLNGFFIFLIIVHGLIGIFGLYRMRIRPTVNNPQSTFTPVPAAITTVGLELDPDAPPTLDENRVFSDKTETKEN